MNSEILVQFGRDIVLTSGGTRMAYFRFVFVHFSETVILEVTPCERRLSYLRK